MSHQGAVETHSNLKHKTHTHRHTHNKYNDKPARSTAVETESRFDAAAGSLPVFCMREQNSPPTTLTALTSTSSLLTGCKADV